MTNFRWLGLPLLGAVLHGCAAVTPHCAGGATAALQDTLYFGTGKPGGGVVTDAEWATFLATEVMPRFPAGLTVMTADGQWLGDDGKITSEQSQVLQLVHAADAASNT